MNVIYLPILLLDITIFVILYFKFTLFDLFDNFRHQNLFIRKKL